MYFQPLISLSVLMPPRRRGRGSRANSRSVVRCPSLYQSGRTGLAAAPSATIPVTTVTSLPSRTPPPAPLQVSNLSVEDFIGIIRHVVQQEHGDVSAVTTSAPAIVHDMSLSTSVVSCVVTSRLHYWMSHRLHL